MGMSEFLTELRALHHKAKDGTLSASEARDYDLSRDELAGAIIAAQNLTVKPDEKPRQALRVAKAMPVELKLPGGNAKAMTLDVSAKGFSVLLARELVHEGRLKFRLRLPGQVDIEGEATVSDANRQRLSTRVGFEIKELSAEDQRRLELTVFDEVLARFGAA